METIRANEHTVRTFWKEYLDDELRGKPIDIYYDPSIRKSKGSKFPDFYILNKQTTLVVRTPNKNQKSENLIILFSIHTHYLYESCICDLYCPIFVSLYKI